MPRPSPVATSIGPLTRVFLGLLVGAASSKRVAIVGAHGGLGRELVQQCRDRAWTPVAMVRRPYDPILPPVRTGWLTPGDERTTAPFYGLEVFGTHGEATECPDCDAVVFAMSGSPFRKDSTPTDVVRGVCATLPEQCTRVCLVSAHGVGDSIEDANLGIRVMREWYLQSTYEGKAAQETLVAALPVPVGRRILRPRVLSYAPVPLNPVATTRRDLACDILDWI